MQPLHLVVDLGARRLEGHFDFEHFVDFLQGKPDGDFMAAACIFAADGDCLSHGDSVFKIGITPRRFPPDGP